METAGTQVNTDMDWQKVPKCRLVGVMRILSREFQDYGQSSEHRTGLCSTKWTQTARSSRLGVVPDREAAFVYSLVYLIFINLRLKSGGTEARGDGGRNQAHYRKLIGRRHWHIDGYIVGISVEVQWREDGARCEALTVSLVNTQFKAMGGERKVVGAPSAKEEDDGLVVGTGDTRALCRH